MGGEGAERAFEVLTRSGELENITPSTSPEIPNSLFGYSNREPEEILTNIASQHRDIINRSTPFSSLQRKQIAVLARIYLATSTISEKRGSLQQKRSIAVKKKKEEEQESTLVQIGIKAGLPLLFSLIRRSWRRDDSELCSEVFMFVQK